jgi:uncharacterized protein YdhG (YjbR/CyaY superfamily)
MPDAIRKALEGAGLMEAYRLRPPFQRNDYLGWIARAKRPQTGEKRLKQMLDELRDGHLYMGMDWKAKKALKAETVSRAPDGGLRAIEEYIESFPEEGRRKLREIRAIISGAAKGADERMSYGMPSFHSGGPVAYYACNKAHIGFYPTASGIAAFEGELGAYKHSKGAVRFPLGEKLPAALIRRIVKYRMAELKAKY